MPLLAWCAAPMRILDIDLEDQGNSLWLARVSIATQAELNVMGYCCWDGEQLIWRLYSVKGSIHRQICRGVSDSAFPAMYYPFPLDKYNENSNHKHCVESPCPRILGVMHPKSQKAMT